MMKSVRKKDANVPGNRSLFFVSIGLRRILRGPPTTGQILSLSNITVAKKRFAYFPPTPIRTEEHEGRGTYFCCLRSSENFASG